MGDPELIHTAAHVPKSLREEWDKEIEEMGTSNSEFIKMMVEAGRKKFDRQVEPDKTRAELRKELGSVLSELDEKNEEVQSLRRQLKESERGTIIEYVESNPGADFGDIRQHLLATMGGRMTALITEMEGSELRVDDDGRYYAGTGPGGDND